MCWECDIIIEILVLKETLQGSSSRDTDFSSLMSIVNASEPCFVLFRDSGSQWIFISFVPDKASVRDKMLYASANTNIRQDFGDSHFVQAARLSLLSVCYLLYLLSIKSVYICNT